MYNKQTWVKYNAELSREENIANGGVVTADRMNHIEEGIANIELTPGPQGEKGDKGEKGDPFAIAKTYATIEEMEADAANVEAGLFVMIVSDVADEDNAKLYVKGEEAFTYVCDMSGMEGIQGPQGEKGETGAAGADGANGEDGYTPVKGTDYFTEEDIEEMVQAVLDTKKVLPYVDDELKSVFCCGVHGTIEAGDTEDTFKLSWTDVDGVKSISAPITYTVYGGGNGTVRPVYYPATSIIMDSGCVNAIFGGNYGSGVVGHATIVMNGGKFNAQWNGISGGSKTFINATGKHAITLVGTTNIIINNTDDIVGTVFGGSGNGLAVVGSANVIMNGGEVYYLTAAGSNGITDAAKAVINGGTVKILQGCNRGRVSNIELEVNGGTVEKMYAGCDLEDSTTNATYDLAVLKIMGGTVVTLMGGRNGEVEDATKVKGKYVDGVIVNETELTLEKTYTLEALASKVASLEEALGSVQ